MKLTCETGFLLFLPYTCWHNSIINNINQEKNTKGERKWFLFFYSFPRPEKTKYTEKTRLEGGTWHAMNVYWENVSVVTLLEFKMRLDEWMNEGIQAETNGSFFFKKKEEKQWRYFLTIIQRRFAAVLWNVLGKPHYKKKFLEIFCCKRGGKENATSWIIFTVAKHPFYFLSFHLPQRSM